MATTPAELDAIFAEMEAAALADLMQEQFPRERLQTRRHAGMRYRGQSYEVAVPVPRLRERGRPRRSGAAVSRRASAALRPHGAGRSGRDRQFPGDGGRAHSEAGDEGIRQRRRAQAKPSETRQAYFNAGDARDVPVFRRSTLQPGMRIEGPAIIEEKTSTTVLYPGQRAQVDVYLNIEVALRNVRQRLDGPVYADPLARPSAR